MLSRNPASRAGNPYFAPLPILAPNIKSCLTAHTDSKMILHVTTRTASVIILQSIYIGSFVLSPWAPLPTLHRVHTVEVIRRLMHNICGVN